MTDFPLRPDLERAKQRLPIIKEYVERIAHAYHESENPLPGDAAIDDATYIVDVRCLLLLLAEQQAAAEANAEELLSSIRIELSSIPRKREPKSVASNIAAMLVRSLIDSFEETRDELCSLTFVPKPCRGDQHWEATVNLSSQAARMLNVPTKLEV